MRITLLLAALATAIVTFFASPAAAQSKSGVDGLMSSVMQERQSSISGWGIRGRFHSKLLLDNVMLLPTLEWWRSASHIDPYGIETVRADNTLDFDAAYEFPMKGMVPYVGGGYAMHFMSSKVNAPVLGVNNAEKTVTKGGLTVLLGAFFPLSGSVQNFVELKYHHLSDYRQLKLTWGLSVDF
jgi:hypothetical protein